MDDTHFVSWGTNVETPYEIGVKQNFTPKKKAPVYTAISLDFPIEVILHRSSLFLIIIYLKEQTLNMISWKDP